MTSTSNEDPSDRATRFTLQYLQILKARLYFSPDDLSTDRSNLNAFSLKRTKEDLTDLMRGFTLQGALEDTRGSSLIQTVGFGMVQDFDKFVKLGFLNGQRVVLWDLIASRLLTDDNPRSELVPAVAGIASNLVALEEVAKSGGVVILPPPAYWSKTALSELQKLQMAGYDDAFHQGLVAALAIISDGFSLHPYTFFDIPSAEWPNHPTGLKFDSHYPEQHAIFHRSMASLFEDKEFAFLENLSIAEFYRIFVERAVTNGSQPFYDALRQHFSSAFLELSPQEREVRLQTLKTSLLEAIENVNRERHRALLSNAGMTASSVLGTGTIINAVVLGDPTSSIALLIGAFAAGLPSVLSHVLGEKERSIVVQAFGDAKHSNPKRSG